MHHAEKYEKGIKRNDMVITVGLRPHLRPTLDPLIVARLACRSHLPDVSFTVNAHLVFLCMGHAPVHDSKSLSDEKG